MSFNKNPQFENYRKYYYQDLTENPSALFNFFYENNDIFKFINDEDIGKLNQQLFKLMNTTMNWTFGSFAGVLFTDQVLFRYFAPNFKIPKFRALIFLSKYVMVPMISYKYARDYLCSDVQETFLDVASKYNFGIDEYNRAMDIFERAHQVGKFEELIEQRTQFDWTGIPPFKTAS